MHSHGEHWSVETVELILYELRPNSHKTAEVICQQLQGEHGDNQSIEQLPDPSARLTLSVENLTFVRLLQKGKKGKI